MKKYKVLDLFCGAGGLSYGFKLAGFNIVGGVEWNPAAMETHKANFKSRFEYCGNIEDITDDEILDNFKGVDVIIGGPPCQGFSSANRHEKEKDDSRNKLFFQYLRFVELLKPKVFVIENVRQILTKNNGYAKNRILDITQKLGYKVNVDVLNAADFGVPQVRRRAIFVGLDAMFGKTFDFSKLKKTSKTVTVYDAIGDICYPERHLENSFLNYVKDTDKLENHNPKEPNAKVAERIKYVPQGGNWKDVPEYLWDTKRTNRHSSAYKRLSFSEPSITIDTGHMNYFHPIFNRIPTVRESARLQSFPDSFIFYGNQGEQFKQVGNAVPPLLAKAVAVEILSLLKEEEKMAKFKIIDLFCGAGGFSLGFEHEGFHSVLAIDKWKDAVDTYNYNRKDNCALNIDIHDYTDQKIDALIAKEKVDGIIGGPPCQGFSLVGKRETGDERNSLYLEYVRFVAKIKPSFFILENVKGLLSMENGLYKKDIIKRFGDLGYNVSYKLLRASDYGVPQSRERVIFVGLNRDKFKNDFFDFDKIKKQPMVSTFDALSDLPSLDNGEPSASYRIEPQNSYQKKMRKNCSCLTNNEITHHTDQTINIISKIKDGGNIKDLPEEYYKVRNYNAAFKRMNSKLPSGTIDCGHRNYFHYKENRIPTARESARIQSFPDTYFFTGNKSSQYTQVGNAVPVILAEQIAKAIKEYLEEEDKHEVI